MNQVNERMIAWLAEADTKRANACLQWLRGSLTNNWFNGTGPIREVIERDIPGHLRLLAEKPTMCKAIEELAG